MATGASEVDSRTSNVNAKDSSLILETTEQLSLAQKARIEQNRQKALTLREEHGQKRTFNSAACSSVDKAGLRTVIDSGGGFLLDEEDDEVDSRPNVVHPPGAILEWEELVCEECEKQFVDSYLFDKFNKYVCDVCKDMEEKHRLITKSDAKERYLLKDVDLDAREPVLKFIVKKNPHNHKWGDMKLYLESQVAERALIVWQSDDKLKEAREARNQNKDKIKKKKFDKKVKELRMSVRSSLYKKTTAGHHHEYGPEIYNEETDVYTKTCTTCGHHATFEKM